MSVEHLKALREQAGISDQELAKRMGITLAQFTDLLTEKARFRRLYSHALDKAALSVALEQKNPRLMSPLLQRQILRIAIMALQTYEPQEAALAAE